MAGLPPVWVGPRTEQRERRHTHLKRGFIFHIKWNIPHT